MVVENLELLYEIRCLCNLLSAMDEEMVENLRFEFCRCCDELLLTDCKVSVLAFLFKFRRCSDELPPAAADPEKLGISTPLSSLAFGEGYSIDDSIFRFDVLLAISSDVRFIREALSETKNAKNM